MSLATADRPINLTLLADRRSSGEERDQPSHPLLLRGDLIAELCGRDAAGELPETSSTHDEIYVVTVGYGYLRHPSGDLTELTQGDVVFVPAGPRSRFESVSTRFQTWRIRLFQPPVVDGN